MSAVSCKRPHLLPLACLLPRDTAFPAPEVALCCVSYWSTLMVCDLIRSSSDELSTETGTLARRPRNGLEVERLLMPVSHLLHQYFLPESLLSNRNSSRATCRRRCHVRLLVHHLTVPALQDEVETVFFSMSRDCFAKPLPVCVSAVNCLFSSAADKEQLLLALRTTEGHGLCMAIFVSFVSRRSTVCSAALRTWNSYFLHSLPCPLLHFPRLSTAEFT